LRRAIKKLLPHRIREGIRDWRALPWEARWAWLSAAQRRLLHGQDITRLPAVLPREPTILFVCYGNIFRSPLAEALLRRAVERHRIRRIRVASAGLIERAGRLSPPTAQEVARELGVSLADHRSQPINSDLVADADLVIIMDRRNEALVLSQYPEATGKLVLLGAFAPLPAPDGVIITDPYDRDKETVRRVFKRIDCAVLQLYHLLALSQETTS